MNGQEESILDTLRCESEQTRNLIAQKNDGGQKAVMVGVAVFSVAMPLTLRDGKTEVLFVLPVLLSAVAMYAINVFVEVLALGGYRRCLEEEINRIHDAPILQWDRLIAPAIHHASWSARSLWGLLASIVLLSWLVAGWVAQRKYGWIGGTIAGSGFVLLSVAIAASLGQLIRAYDKAYALGSSEIAAIRAASDSVQLTGIQQMESVGCH